MPTLEEIKDYLGIDYADDMTDRRLTNLIDVSKSIIEGAVGVNYPADNPKIKELALILIADLYDLGDNGAKLTNNIERYKNTLCTQLRLEMRDNDVSQTDNN